MGILTRGKLTVNDPPTWCHSWGKHGSMCQSHRRRERGESRALPWPCLIMYCQAQPPDEVPGWMRDREWEGGRRGEQLYFRASHFSLSTLVTFPTLYSLTFTPHSINSETPGQERKAIEMSVNQEELGAALSPLPKREGPKRSWVTEDEDWLRLLQHSTSALLSFSVLPSFLPSVLVWEGLELGIRILLTA